MHQRNWSIHSRHWFTGSFDAQRPEWSWSRSPLRNPPSVSLWVFRTKHRHWGIFYRGCKPEMNVAPDTPRLVSLRALIQIFWQVSSTFLHGIPPHQRMKYSPKLHVQWKCPCWVQQAPRSWNKINCITTFFNFNLSTFSKSKFHDFWIWLYPFVENEVINLRLNSTFYFIFTRKTLHGE